MANRSTSARRDVGRILRECLDTGRSVEIDGLGKFRALSPGRFEFVPEALPKVFLAYVEEDLAAVRELADELESAGFNPWLDKRKLLPGQNWPRSIQRAIGVSDFFVPCFSRRSIYKPGNFQCELRYALDCASKVPLDEIFIVPVRLERCEVPSRIAEHIHYVDLFPVWQKGVARMVAAMRRQVKLRTGRRILLAG